MTHKNPQHEIKEMGLLLQSIPYLGGKQILKILTPSYGLITLIGRSKIKELFLPFHLAEWVYQTGRLEMGKLIEGSIIERFSFDSYQKILCAGKICSDLLKTELPGKCAQNPFELSIAFLKTMQKTQNPKALLLAFRLKLLRLEGMLDPSLLNPDLQTLCLSKSFTEIQAAQINEPLELEVDALFKPWI